MFVADNVQSCHKYWDTAFVFTSPSNSFDTIEIYTSTAVHVTNSSAIFQHSFEYVRLVSVIVKIASHYRLLLFLMLCISFQSMMWPFLALQLLFVCVPSFRQVSQVLLFLCSGLNNTFGFLQTSFSAFFV